jgi:hypothetical protein
MPSYLDINRKLQDAVKSYLQTNLATYEAGVANSLPKITAGDFDDLGKDHVVIYAPEANEDPPYSGTYNCQVMIRVATLRDTALATHRNYCKAVFDLLSDTDLATYINAISGSKIRVNQVIDSRSFTTGIINESMRHDSMSFNLRVYQVT